jgi:hypothetical protein
MRRRAALVFFALLALSALAAGAWLAYREKTRPERELTAIERARARAKAFLAEPHPEVDALAERASEDSFKEVGFSCEDVAIYSLVKKESTLVWHLSAKSPFADEIAKAIRGEQLPGELSSLELKDPPLSFSAFWSLGIENGEARVAVLLGKRRGPRVVAVFWIVREACR